MGKAIGMAELITVSEGIAATDRMIKTAEVDVLEAQTVCPGKYIVIISGELSAVKASLEAVKTFHSEKLIDSFVLGNPHESIFPAIYSTARVDEVEALGVMETFSAASAIVAADAAAKCAQVELIELRLARGMCGKSYLMLTGSVASVTAAIERASHDASVHGMFLDSTVIPNPDKKLWDTIL
jgi:microcompartment protein CcmL/EutN